MKRLLIITLILFAACKKETDTPSSVRVAPPEPRLERNVKIWNRGGHIIRINGTEYDANDNFYGVYYQYDTLNIYMIAATDRFIEITVQDSFITNYSGRKMMTVKHVVQ